MKGAAYLRRRINAKESFPASRAGLPNANAIIELRPVIAVFSTTRPLSMLKSTSLGSSWPAEHAFRYSRHNRAHEKFIHLVVALI